MTDPVFDFPPPLNNTLAAWLFQQNSALHTAELYEICRYLHNQFTQFNEKSKLLVVRDRLIVNKYLHSEYGETVFKPTKTPAPGLRNALRRFWRRVLPYSYWQALHERFPELARYRPEGYTYGSVAEPDAQFTRLVKLERFGFHGEVSPLLAMLEGDRLFVRFDGEFEFMAGYEALTDTLYVSEKCWIRTAHDYQMGPM